MKEKILMQLISLFVSFVSEDILKMFADGVLDIIEDYAERSESKWDDKILLPMCGKVREVFDIPDNDEESKGAEG